MSMGVYVKAAPRTEGALAFMQTSYEQRTRKLRSQQALSRATARSIGAGSSTNFCSSSSISRSLEQSLKSLAS
jgi:hypothetical protein